MDALHTDTYRIRGGLYRNMKESEKDPQGGAVKHKVSVSVGGNIGKFGGGKDVGGRVHFAGEQTGP